MKKIFLLGVAVTSLILGTGTAVNSVAREKEVLDADIIVGLKGDVNSLSEDVVIRQQNNVISQIKNYITPDFEVGDRYTNLVNAFNLKVNASHVSAIRDLMNVKTVNYNTQHAVQTEGDGIISINNELNVKEAKENVSAQTMNIPTGTKEGEGVLIAILDTGFLLKGKTFNDDGTVKENDVTHNAFTKLDKSVALHDNYESINEKISKAKNFHGKPDAEHPVYFNSKVPFYYDYGGETSVRGEAGEEDHDVFTTVSEHGTHVASIAAGNDPFYKGIAPKAQLALMKVFTDYIPTEEDAIAGATASTGAYDTCVLKALEDCAVLGVDVINMSLGSALIDFNEDSLVGQAITQLQNRGTFLDIAAGNEGKNTFANSAYEFWSTDMVETGILSTYSNSDGLIVAAAQADKEYYETAFILGSKTIAFRDQVVNYKSADGDVVYEPERYLTDLLKDHPDGKFDWVRIGGWGEPKDYEDLEVEGKIAIVDRGETTFVSKISAATEAKAIAIGIIDNDPTNTDFTFRMDLSGWTPDIPVVSFLFRDKEYIDSVTDHTATLLANVEANNPTARTMTSFSSDGPTFDLRIKPEISAPGQSILGAVITDKDAYEYLNGTSMATPNTAGVTALLLSENNTKEYRDTLNDRMMSTADPMKDTFGTNFDSVRKQGAGLIDVGGALNSKVYLDGTTTSSLTKRAKIELGNNDDIKAGNVKLSFTAINEGDAAVTYKATSYIYRPELVTLDAEQYPDFKDKKLQATYNHLIEKVEQNITVNPGSNLINLNNYSIPASEKTTIENNFDNGCYIEGFVVLTAEGQETLNIPFLGYYGDINDSDAIEPFTFERDPSKVYGSDVLNSVIHKWKGLNDANYASMWVAGYAETMKDVSMEKIINNTTSIDKMAGYSSVGINPRTGKPSPKDIYVGNNGFTNTMIIQQFVMRSISDNVITITNKATGKVVLIDHMFDEFYGATEDENEHAYQWPLLKSHVNVDYWSAGYVASRAYTIIPLYSMDADGNKLANFPDGEYDMTFSYDLASGGKLEKSYVLHIDSDAPYISSSEKYEKDGEEYYRVRFSEEQMAGFAVAGKNVDVLEDEQGFYYDFKVSDYAKGYAFIKSRDFAGATTLSIAKLDDPYLMTVSNSSLSLTHTFTYTETDNAEFDKTFDLSFKKGSSGAVVKGSVGISMKLPEGWDSSKLMVYGLTSTKSNRVKVSINGDFISFTINSTTVTRFRLSASPDNDATYGLLSLSAYSCTRQLEVGQSFSEDSITVFGNYEGGFSQEITSGFTVDASNINKDKEGRYTVKVSFGGKSCDIKIDYVLIDKDEGTIILEDTPDVVVDPNGTRDPFDPEPEPEPSKGGGCGGSILASSLLISVMSFAALGLIVARRRKED